MPIRQHADRTLMQLRPRSFVAWLAILSLLLNGLTPLVVHAAGNAAAASMAVCSTSASGKSDAPLKSGASYLHCAYCCSGSDGSAALPGRAASQHYTENLSRARHAASMRVPVDLRFSRAQARAPPGAS